MRLSSPEKDHTWFQRAPTVHGPACFNAMIVGPALHFPLPSVGSLVEGSTITGPAPQIRRVDFDGAMKNDEVMSLMPNAAEPPSTSGG